MVRSQNEAPRTSLRSEAQATDSTRSGCSANRNATSALGHSAAVEDPQQDEQEHGVRGVKGDAHAVMPRRVETEELDVGHVREPGQRVPVVGVGGGERPRHAPRGEAGANLVVAR